MRREGQHIIKIVPLELETHFAEGTVNTFLAIGETVTLIDTGNPGKEAFQQLKEKLHKHDIALKDIDHIVLTHIHIDHAGGIPHIQEEIDVPIYVHEQAKDLININKNQFERNQHFFHQFLESCGADPLNHMFQRRFKEENWRNLTYLSEGNIVPIAGQEFKVVHVPGHSQSDILLWNAETGDAFAGDHLIKAFSVNAFIEPPTPSEMSRPKPLLQYRESLEKVRQLPLEMIYPGHGETFNDHQSLIKLRLFEQEKRCHQIVEILRNGEKCIYEICKEMYPKLKGRTIFLGLSQIQGHLDLLEFRNQVVWEQKGRLIRYRITQ